MAILAGRNISLVWPFRTKDPSQYQRVDQGWDLKGPIGDVLAVAPGTVQYAGPDPSGFGIKYPVLMLDNPSQYGRAVYYGHVVPTVPAGTHVTAGQPIATTAQGPQGNATIPGWLEIGWWNNGPTGNGQAMKDALMGATVGGGAAGAQTLIFTYAQLQCLWTQAGGNPQYQAMAAAIAMAESNGNSQVTHTNTNGSIDRGLWQINSSNGAASTLDIMGNARAAVAMSNKGVNWRPWCTAYSDGLCGTRGGTYLGTGSPYQKFYKPDTPADCNFSINGTNAAANISGTSATDTGFHCDATGWILTPGVCLAGTIQSAATGAVVKAVFDILINSILNPLIEDFIGIQGITAGLLIMGYGIWLTINQTSAGRAATAPARFGARVAGTAAAPELFAATGGERTAARTMRTARFNVGARAERDVTQARAAAARQNTRVMAQQAAARQRQEQVRVTTTESQTTGPPGARKTQRVKATYTTTRDDLRNRANDFRNRS